MDNVWARRFSYCFFFLSLLFLENDFSKVNKILGLIFCVEKAVSWIQRFVARDILPKKQMTKKQMFAEILRFKWKGQRMLQENDVLLEQPSRHV